MFAAHVESTVSWLLAFVEFCALLFIVCGTICADLRISVPNMWSRIRDDAEDERSKAHGLP